MKNNTGKFITGLAATSWLAAFVPGLQAEIVTALQESFETDGAGSRYFVIGGGDNAELTFFARREQFSAGADATGGTIDGNWFWGASDIDAINNDLPSDDYPGLGNRDGVLVFNDIDISDLGNLRIEMAVAQGEGTFEPDNHFQIQIRFDDSESSFGLGDWFTIGGFRAVSTNTPGRYFSGPLRLTTDADPRLTSNFQDWSWDIWGFGDTIDVRLVINSNFFEEDYYVDNIRITGDNAVVLVDASLPSTELTEPETSETVNVTFTANQPAPAGGLTFNVISDVWLDATLPMPETVTIPEGQTSLTVPLDHLADGRFTGPKLVEARFDSDAISRESLIFTVNNTTPKPRVLIMEVLNVFPGTIESDVIGDANGDGARTYPGDLFVEIVNFEDYPVDLTGWTIEDDLGPRFQYPDGTIIQPGRAHVTFGGGEPLGVFGGAPVLTVGTSNGFAFNTTRAEIAGLFAPFGGEMEIVDLPFQSQILETTLALPESDPAYGETASIHRTSDEVGSEFTLHSLINGAGSGQSLFFSPGTRPDGTPYFTPSTTVSVTLAADTAMEGDGPVQGTISLSNAAPAGGLELFIEATETGTQVSLSDDMITIPSGQSTAAFTITPIDDAFLDGPKSISVIVNGEEGGDVLGGFDTILIEDNESNIFDFEIAEFLIDLAGTGEDPNLDGNVEQGVADQFIEIVNRSGFPVNMDGWSLIMRVGGQFSIREVGHSFGSVFLKDNGAAVVFGEISGSAAVDPSFAGAWVEDASNDDGNGGLHAAAGESVFVDLVNEFGFVITTLEIPAELTGQGMSVTLVDGTPILHLEAAVGSFNLFSPGTQPDGTPYPGNGPWEPQEVLGDITRTAPSEAGVLALSDSLGWLFVESWPTLFNYRSGDWWAYLLTTEFGNHWFYNYADGDYLWINPAWYPWAYSLNAQDWVVVE
jgi:hypothetical protein